MSNNIILFAGVKQLYVLQLFLKSFTLAILEIESKDIKRHFCPRKNQEKAPLVYFSNTYVHSIFTLLLMKQIFENNKSSRTDSKNWTQFFPRISPVSFCRPPRGMKEQQLVQNNLSVYQGHNSMTKRPYDHNFWYTGIKASLMFFQNNMIITDLFLKILIGRSLRDIKVSILAQNNLYVYPSLNSLTKFHMIIVLSTHVQHHNIFRHIISF